MTKHVLRSLVTSICARLGISVRRMGAFVGRDTLTGVLRQARAAGCKPRTLFDVGAAFGDFSREFAAIFPEARCMLVEPLAEYTSHLDEVQRTVPRVEIIRAAASDQVGEATLHVHPDLVGTSLFVEDESPEVNGVPRQVPTVTLDALQTAQQAEPPYFLKLDVQGAELAVLSGAEHVLAQAEYVILETSLFEFYQEAPLFATVVEYMQARGFVVYDIFGVQYRPLDAAVSQVDLAFVPATSPLRRFHHYASPAQRVAQTRQLARR